MLTIEFDNCDQSKILNCANQDGPIVMRVKMQHEDSIRIQAVVIPVQHEIGTVMLPQ